MEHLPLALRAIIDRAEVTQIHVGHSGDRVFHVDADEGYYLKIGDYLTDECERLEWLTDKLPVPRKVHFEVNQGKHYLLMTAVHGEMMHEVNLPMQQRIELLAEAAHMWHDLPIEDCPFEWGINAQIETARNAIQHGRVNAADFDNRFYGKSAQELFADLLNAMPDEDEGLVLTHGDLCLPNVLVNPRTGEISGFVDVGECNLSNRYLDLVLCAWSIMWNLGGSQVRHFYEAYGMPEAPAKTHFYMILREFF